MFERTGRPINTWLSVGVGAALTASFATSSTRGSATTARPCDGCYPEVALVPLGSA